MALKVYKSVAQKHVPNSGLEVMMKVFTRMVNWCLRIGLGEGAHNMKRLMNSRDGTGEAQSGTFEPAMTKSSRPVIRIVDMSESTLHDQRN